MFYSILSRYTEVDINLLAVAGESAVVRRWRAGHAMGNLNGWFLPTPTQGEFVVQ